MLYLFQARLEKPAGMSQAEFYGIWEKESEAAVRLIEAGQVRAGYKVAGEDEIAIIMDLPSNDSIDEMILDLPIWRLGYHDMVKDVRWTPLRDYADWYNHLKILSGSRPRPEAPTPAK